MIVGSNSVPRVAIVDPMMALTLPPTQTAYSRMDALSHLIVGLVSNQVFPMTDALALEGVGLVSSSLRTAYHNGQDLHARWSMPPAAMIAGFLESVPGFGGSWLGHCVAELIGPKYHIPRSLKP